MRQRGGALFAVIILLALSAALLNATRRLLEQGLSRIGDEQRYLQQTSLAASALAWGSQQVWPVVAGWQCRQQSAAGWRSCLLSAGSSAPLLRADSGASSIAFYQWVTRDPDGGIRALPHGWLDYCPLVEEERCDPDEQATGF